MTTLYRLFKVWLMVLASIAVLTGCEGKTLNVSMTAVGGAKVSGEVAQFTSLSAPSTCNTGTVSLFELDSAGQKAASAIASAPLNSNGTYVLNTMGLNVDLKTTSIKYLIVFSGCSEELSRPLTGNNAQNLSRGSTLLSYLSSVQDPAKRNLSEIQKTQIQNLVANLENVSGSDLESVFTSAQLQSDITNSFTSTFNTNITSLQFSMPDISAIQLHSSVAENTLQNFSITASHWHSSSSLVYEWRANGNLVSNLASYVWLPSKNQQGVRTIEVRVGFDNGVGGVDTSKAYYSRTENITINNTYPAIVPGLVLNSSLVSNSRNVSASLGTGAAMANCETFSGMALTENNLIAPPSASAYSIICSSAPSQVLNYTLSAGDGVKVLRLWAMDEAGYVSAAAQSITVTLDQTPPQITLGNLATHLAGGITLPVSFSLTDAMAGLATAKLQFAPDGSTFNDVSGANLLVSSSPYAWIVPSLTVAGGRLRIVATDLAGNSNSETSSPFEIDSTAPAAPAILRSSSAISKSSTVAISVTCTADYDKILFSETSTRPLASDPLWENCDSNKSFVVSAADGLKTIYAFTKDLAGNISTSSSISMTLDRTDPVMVLGVTPGFRGNGAYGNLTWSLTELHVGAGTTFNIELFNGAVWNTVGAVNATAGANSNASYSMTAFNVPNVNVTNAKIRVTIVDAALNSKTIASGDFTIDSSAPVLSSVDINNGATFAGTAIVNLKIAVSDNISASNQILVRTGNANSGTLSCQSEYSDTNWIPYTNATTNVQHVIVPTDGIKKVCVWAKDSIGNVSEMTPGSLGVDFDTIEYQVGNPPQVTGFSAKRASDNATDNILVGQPMKIEWQISDVEGLPTNAISFAYTTDNEIWKDLSTGLDINQSANVTWVGGLTSGTLTGSGQITTWTAPSAGFFRVKAVARDLAGNTSKAVMSQVFNVSGWTVYAGSKDRGVGGSGRSATLYCYPVSNLFAVNPKNGDIYSADCGYGVRKLDAATGIVSTFIEHGALNLPNDGPLPATPKMSVGSYAQLIFDSKGRLYVSYNSNGSLTTTFQIDLENNSVRKYLGGGTDPNSSNPLLATAVIGNGSFDEDDSLYFFTYCDPPASIEQFTSSAKILKLTQNSDGSPGTITHIAGNCTRGAITSGVAATASPLGPALDYPMYSGIAAWDHGQKIFVNGLGVSRFKILSGTIYTSNLTSGGNAWILYNKSDQALYTSNSTGGINKITPSFIGSNGEVATSILSGNSTALGCNADGTPRTSYCGDIDTKISFSNGQMLFVDGVKGNSQSNYSIRMIDSQNKIQTIFGSLPLAGDGGQKELAKGSFAGIYYKKASEGNQAGFPEGLYFMERLGVSFGHIDSNSGVLNVLWGNQNRKDIDFVNGETISKVKSMSFAYSGGNGFALTFDNTGLPWMRADQRLIKINASRAIEAKSTGTMYWHDLAEGQDPSASYLHVYTGLANLTIKNQALFGIGGAYAMAHPTSPVNPRVTIKILDFGASTTTTIMGAGAKYFDLLPPSSDTGPGNVINRDMWYACGIGSNCFSFYDEINDRLYFSEEKKIRYITTPSNTATAELITAVTHTSAIANFTLRPDRSQIWFIEAGKLFCKDISSGKSWCDGVTNHFASMSNAKFMLYSGANQFTWKDDGQMFLSNYDGEILSFKLPTTP